MQKLDLALTAKPKEDAGGAGGGGQGTDENVKPFPVGRFVCEAFLDNVLKQSARPDAALASSAMAALSEIRRSLEGKLSK